MYICNCYYCRQNYIIIIKHHESFSHRYYMENVPLPQQIFVEFASASPQSMRFCVPQRSICPKNSIERWKQLGLC